MSVDELVEWHGVPVLACAADGPPVVDDAAAMDLVGAALGAGASLVRLPVRRLPEEFFTLRSGHAGNLVQKFVNYRIQLVVVGDITDHLGRSEALRAFVAESNRGRQLWFVSTDEELATRLAG